MGKQHLLNPLDFSSFAVIQLGKNEVIENWNDKAQFYFKALVNGEKITDVLSWFRSEWLNGNVNDRVVKTSPSGKLLMNVITDSMQEACCYLLFKNTDEYRNLMHLWCEVEDSLIRLQPFIDNSHDGIIITNGEGIVRAINQSFCGVSGIAEDDLLGKSVYELAKNKQIPTCSMMRVLEHKKSENSVVKFPAGKETIVSSTPLMNKKGEVIRVLSNVRDITELEKLHDKLRSAEAAAKHYQRELSAKIMEEAKSKLMAYHSRKMEDLYELVEQVADTELPLLLTGESGVGKTELAKHIHALSERNNTGSFVHINCSAIPENLLESELFGYEAGAFTGAQRTRIGLFEIAQHGTILLDEIGDMPMALQAKMLNVLQEKNFYRIGGSKPIQADVRVMVATNQNLEELIAKGLFRRDLFFRLNVIPIAIPSLRDRKEDIAPLIAYYLKQINTRHKRMKSFSSDALAILFSYSWPGNIREVMNVIERLVVLTKDEVIEPRHLPLEMVRNLCVSQCSTASFTNNSPNKREDTAFWKPGDSLKGAVNHLENEIIEQAVTFYGSLKAAAKNLGIDESTLTRKRRRGMTLVLANDYRDKVHK